MKKLFTFFSTIMLSLAAFAATEAAWYNDVTAITNGNQYYIYSVNGAGFVQGGNNKVVPITPDNYNSEADLLFTIEDQNGAKTHSGSHYLSSYQAGTNGPVGSESTSGTNIYWTSMNDGEYWNIHGKYNFLGDKYACLQYDGGYSGLANVLGKKETHTNAKSQWYLISPAHYDRHFAIYFYDLYKESISDYTQYENQVPAAYYTALAAAYAVTYDVTNPEHSKEAVQAHHTDLKALYDNAPAVAQAYSDAKATINALEAVEDKGEDFAEVTAGISAARQAIENALSVEALNTAVSAPNLKAIDPITFNVTSFMAISSVSEAASSATGRTLSYVAADEAIINAGMAIYKGATTLTATAAATDAYYKFVRSAQVTVDAPTTYGDFAQTTCDEPVEFNEKTYTETTQEDVNVGLNFMGSDSIVHVSVVINHASFGAEEMTIAYGAEETWKGIDLKDSTVGVHTVIFDTINAVGCDSLITLTLTVTKQEALEIQQSLEFCEGDSVEFRGVWYKEAQEPFVINAEGATRDTVYVVTVNVLQPTTGTDTKTIVVGTEESWNGIALKDSTVGVHYVVYETTNVAGCDSTVTLTLTVTKANTVEVPVNLEFCAGDSAEYRHVTYTEAGVYPVLVEGIEADTLFTITVTVNELYYNEDEQSVTVGQVVFFEEDGWLLRGETPVTAMYLTNKADTTDLWFVYYGQTVHGCDSVERRIVTVNLLDPYEAEQELESCEGDSVQYRGVWYAEAGEYPVYAEGEMRDTIINVIVTVHEKAYAEIERTVLAGDVLTLPEGDWTIGDQVVSGTYETLRSDTLGLELYQYDETEFGCESVVKLIVTVTPNYEAIENVFVGEKAEKFFREGQLYIRRGDAVYTITGLKAE